MNIRSKVVEVFLFVHERKLENTLVNPMLKIVESFNKLHINEKYDF